MSDLETRASQVLPQMIEGEGRSLSIEEQAFISSWIMKTIMVWQTVNPSEFTIPLDEYRWFCDNNKIPPALTKIFLGYYIGDELPFMGYAHEGLFREEITEPTPLEPPKAAGYRSILTLGKLVCEIVGSYDGEPFEAAFPPLVGDALIEIWPSLADRHWPPRGLDDEEMLLFLDLPPGVKIP